MQDEDGVHGSSWRGRRRLNMIKQQQMIAGPAVDGSGSILYILSMGHRIHCLSYDSISKQIVVKRYLSRYGSNTTSGNKVSYRYSIWSELENTFRTVEQEFYKYPVSEYAWNHLDEMVRYMRMHTVPSCAACLESNAIAGYYCTWSLVD